MLRREPGPVRLASVYSTVWINRVINNDSRHILSGKIAEKDAAGWEYSRGRLHGAECIHHMLHRGRLPNQHETAHRVGQGRFLAGHAEY